MAATLLPDDPHDRALVGFVRPPGWTNPTPKPRYDLVVLGAGSGGLVSAAGAAAVGARVALVEKHLLGGECLTDGCVPSKALLRAARAAADARRAASLGVHVGDVRADFAAVMDRLRRVRAELAPADSAERFKSLGVDVFLGEGVFVGPDALAVAGQTLRFRRAVVATGSRPAIPDVPGLRDSDVLTNETVFALTELPARLAVLGAGPVGCELAQAFARLGSRVTLLARNGGVLPREDPEAARRVAAALVGDGVAIVNASGVRVDAAWKTIHYGDGSAGFDRILVATGRTPTVHGLGLEAAGVAFDERSGVQVDDRLRTANRRIYAVGDVATTTRFTHAADAMARLAVRNALFAGRGRYSRVVIPRCVYTDPEVAAVGVTDPRAADIPVTTFTVEFRDLDRAVLDGEPDGFIKVLVKKGTDRIVGATIVAPRAGELIGELALAMTVGAGLRRLAATVHPYPTFGEALRKVGDTYNRSRLTPLVRRLLGWWVRR